MFTVAKGKTALAHQRARLRKRSAGATMFVVSITLGALAVMAVFGMSATAADVKAAGHAREGMQSRHLAEHAFMDVNAMLGPITARHVMRSMIGGVGQQTTTCKTANTYTAASRLNCAAEACMLVTPTEIDTIVRSAYPALPFDTYFTPNSFGPSTPTLYPQEARMIVELTDPIDVEVAGTDKSNGQRFVQVIATIFAELRPTGAPLAAPETMVVGRGRITFGPVSIPSCNR